MKRDDWFIQGKPIRDRVGAGCRSPLVVVGWSVCLGGVIRRESWFVGNVGARLNLEEDNSGSQ